MKKAAVGVMTLRPVARNSGKVCMRMHTGFAETLRVRKVALAATPCAITTASAAAMSLWERLRRCSVVLPCSASIRAVAAAVVCKRQCDLHAWGTCIGNSEKCSHAGQQGIQSKAPLDNACALDLAHAHRSTIRRLLMQHSAEYEETDSLQR